MGMGGGMGHGGGGGGWGGGARNPDDEDGRAYDSRVMSRLFSYILDYKLLLLGSTVAMVVYALVAVAIPLLVKKGIDDYVVPGDLSGLNALGVLFVGLLVIHFGANYVHQAMLSWISQRAIQKMRADMFAHLQRLSISYYQDRYVGSIMSRVQNDVQQIQEFYGIMIISMADVLSLGLIVVTMFALDPLLAGVTLAVIPLLVITMLVWQRYARKSFLRVRRAIARVNGALQENIAGVRVVQSLNRQDRNLENFDELNTEHLKSNLSASKLSSALLPSVEFYTALALAGTVAFGGQMVVRGTLEVGTLLAFALYIQRFFDPIRNLTMQYTQFQRAVTSGSRIFELLDSEIEVKDKPEAIALPPIKGELVYDHVKFAYKPGVYVLKDVNLHIKPGQTVALVGHTGSGKTTMVALLSRLYDVTEGSIKIDGYDIRDVTRDSLARQMGMVPQEPFLFSASVRENIRYNQLTATDADVEAAAKAVGADEFIDELPNGYDTILEERGGNLSVGQRQLLSFARALVADPKILVLDEATASIDTWTEQIIQRALHRLLAGRTAVVIAHRLSTIRNADNIVVMHHGEIVEMGTHDQLMARNGLYAEYTRVHEESQEGLFDDEDETERATTHNLQSAASPARREMGAAMRDEPNN